jgi:hypothetical protein
MLAEGSLDPDATNEVLRHVGDCESCSAEFEEFRRMKSLLEDGLDEAITVPGIVDAVISAPLGPKKRTRGRLRFALRWAAISFASAAAAITLLITGYLYSRGFIGPKPVAGRLTHVSRAGEEWQKSEKRIRGLAKIVTEAGERRSLRLNSGVIVILNEETGLEVQSESSLKLLDGDIYVDTAGHKGIVLRIKTDQATTHVTGTKLGVSAEEKMTSVVVEEGKVSVESGWGEQVVVFGNIYRIIESLRPEPPEPVEVGDIFFWVKERERLAGMIRDYFEESDPADDVDDAELLNEILYGINQSRNAISSGDLTFETSRTFYGFEHDLTEEEREKFAEKVVTGHLAQLDTSEAPDEERIRKLIQTAKESAVIGDKPSIDDDEQHWIFSGTDKARLETTCRIACDMVVNGNMKYRPTQEVVHRTNDRFIIPDHPAYFGRSPYKTSKLENPRLLGTEEVNGVTTYKLEADIDIYSKIFDDPDESIESVIRMWVDPSRGFIVLKTITHTEETTIKKYSYGFTQETIAESFEEVSPGIFYPNSYTMSTFMGDDFLGEKILRKMDETFFILRDSEFNVSIPDETFDIPADLPVKEVDEFGRKIVGEAEKQERKAKAEEYLREIYDELEQIKRYDDPTAPGSRKFVFQLSYTADDFSGAVETGQGGVIFSPAHHNGEPVGTMFARISPRVAPNIPFMEGDIIYTINGKPWIFRTQMDLFRGLESCIPILNAGKPIEGGVRRDGELMYFILWFDL